MEDSILQFHFVISNQLDNLSVLGTLHKKSAILSTELRLLMEVRSEYNFTSEILPY